MPYLYRFLKPSHAYYPQWQEMRRRRKVALFALLAWIPATLALGLLAWPISVALESDVLVLAFGIVPAVVVFALFWWFMAWPCPRCRRRFAETWWVRWPFTSSCLNCGLPRYAPCDPAKQEWEIESQMKDVS